MAAHVTLPAFSQFQHATASQIIGEIQACIQALFPVGTYEGEGKVSAFFQYHSSRKGLIILGDALAFSDLRNSCDPLREVSPVIFDCTPRNCSRELFNVITAYGRQIPDSPKLVVIEVDFSTTPPSDLADPQKELSRLIRGEIHQVLIGSFQLQLVQDSWAAPASNPTWQGLAFERTDRLFRSWIHETNPNALQGAREDAQRDIDEIIADRDKKTQERDKHIKASRYQGALKEKIEREINEIDQTLQENQNLLAYLTAQAVNSASYSTLQCNMALEIDDSEKVKLLDRYICQAIAGTIDRAIEEVSWDDLRIKLTAIESLIQQKFKALTEKVDILIKYNKKCITDWEDFKENALADKINEMKLTYKNLCTEKFGHPTPTEEERPQVDKLWKNALSERLKWVTTRLKMADEQLKIVEHFAFTETDISIFESHKKEMIQVLKQKNRFTYGLGLELKKRYDERNLVRAATQAGNSVLLVKRISEAGDLLFGVSSTPSNPEDRPDPNERLNEVHIPIKTIRMPAINR